MSALDLVATGQAPAVSVDDVQPAESERFRLARLAREAALSVPGVVSTDVGPLGLFLTVGGGRKLEGVVCFATKSGGYELSLRLTCSLVPLVRLGEHVRAAVEQAAAAAGVPLERVSVHVADIAGSSVMLLLRAFSRAVGALLMVALALLGLGIALYCFDALVALGGARPDRLLDLPSVRMHVGRFLDQVTAPGVTAGLALLCGLGAILLGALLLAGLLRSRRTRVVVIDRDADGGTLAAKPGALRDIGRVLAQQTPATNVERPKLALNRRGNRGRIKLSATRPRTTDAPGLQRALEESLQPISGPFALQPRVRVRQAEQGERAK